MRRLLYCPPHTPTPLHLLNARFKPWLGKVLGFPNLGPLALLPIPLRSVSFTSLSTSSHSSSHPHPHHPLQAHGPAFHRTLCPRHPSRGRSATPELEYQHRTQAPSRSRAISSRVYGYQAPGSTVAPSAAPEAPVDPFPQRWAVQGPADLLPGPRGTKAFRRHVYEADLWASPRGMASMTTMLAVAIDGEFPPAGSVRHGPAGAEGLQGSSSGRGEDDAAGRSRGRSLVAVRGAALARGAANASEGASRRSKDAGSAEIAALPKDMRAFVERELSALMGDDTEILCALVMGLLERYGARKSEIVVVGLEGRDGGRGGGAVACVGVNGDSASRGDWVGRGSGSWSWRGGERAERGGDGREREAPGLGEAEEDDDNGDVVVVKAGGREDETPGDEIVVVEADAGVAQGRERGGVSRGTGGDSGVGVRGEGGERGVGNRGGVGGERGYIGAVNREGGVGASEIRGARGMTLKVTVPGAVWKELEPFFGALTWHVWHELVSFCAWRRGVGTYDRETEYLTRVRRGR